MHASEQSTTLPTIELERLAPTISTEEELKMVVGGIEGTPHIETEDAPHIET